MLVARTTLFADAAVTALLTAVYPPFSSSPIQTHFYKHGINDIYRVTAGDTVYYWRVGKAGWRSEAAVAEELALVAAVAQAGVPVARPVALKNGRFCHTITAPEGERTAVLFHEAPGTPPKQLTPALSRQLGQFLAQIHSAGDQIGSLAARPSLDVPFLLAEPAHHVAATFGEHEAEITLYWEALAWVKSVLNQHPPQTADFGPCHGDLHAANIHLADGDELTLFDFDFCGAGWRAYDLAVFNWSLWLDGYPEAARTENWAAFVAGYGEKRPLTPTTLALVPALTVARQLWILGLHTGPATWHYGRRWLDDKYRRKHFGLLRQLLNN